MMTGLLVCAFDLINNKKPEFNLYKFGLQIKPCDCIYNTDKLKQFFLIYNQIVLSMSIICYRPVLANRRRARDYLSKVPQFSTQGLDSLSGSGCSLASINNISPTRCALCSCNSASNCLPPLQKLT